jgi:hypothetical protein
LVSQGCYAGPLLDCDGGPLTREHYISENLLKRFGEGFTIEGTPWAPIAKSVGAGALTAHILCKRHNNALSPIDDTIGVLYDALLGALHGRDVGEPSLDGEDLERWAMKLMFGIAASGNVTYPGIGKVVAPTVPVEYLRVLFGEEEFPDGCGFKFVPKELPGPQGRTALSYQINNFPDGDQAAFGITIKILSCFQYLTSLVTPVTQIGHIRLLHQPGGFVLGVPERGHVRLRWRGKHGDRASLILRLTK